MSSSGPDDDQQQQPPQWQQPQWQQPQQGDQPSWQQPQQPSWQQPEQQGWQQSQPQWGHDQQWQQAPQTPGSATAALILGICALVVCPLICGPLAIVYGNKAQTEIDTSNGKLTGRGLATAGLICGWIGTGLALLGILGIFAILASG